MLLQIPYALASLEERQRSQLSTYAIILSLLQPPRRSTYHVQTRSDLVSPASTCGEARCHCGPYRDRLPTATRCIPADTWYFDATHHPGQTTTKLVHKLAGTINYRLCFSYIPSLFEICARCWCGGEVHRISVSWQ
jgi:hypothetical protein